MIVKSKAIKRFCVAQNSQNVFFYKYRMMHGSSNVWSDIHYPVYLLLSLKFTPWISSICNPSFFTRTIFFLTGTKESKLSLLGTKESKLLASCEQHEKLLHCTVLMNFHPFL